MSWATFAILTVFCLATVSGAHNLIFPQQDSYWVACGWNTVAWKSMLGDPAKVALMLTNTDPQVLNGAYDLGSALTSNSSTSTGINVYTVYVPCLSASAKYSIEFLNVSSASGAVTNVFYKSPLFTIKAAGTAPHPASGQKEIPSQSQPPLDQVPAVIIPESIEPVSDLDGSSFPSWPPFDHNLPMYKHNTNDASTSQPYFARLLMVVAATAMNIL